MATQQSLVFILDLDLIPARREVDHWHIELIAKATNMLLLRAGLGCTENSANNSGSRMLLTSSTTIGDPGQEDHEQTHGHSEKTGSRFRSHPYRVVQPQSAFLLPEYLWPAGHLSFSLEQLSVLTQWQLKGLLGENNLLSANTYQYLHYGLDYYTLGWYNGYIGETENRFSYHGGSLGTYSSAILRSPDRAVAILVLIIADGPRVQKMKDALRQRLWQLFSQP